MSEDAPIYDGLNLEWSDISEAAKPLIGTWFLGSEAEFAARAWGMLTRAGLTRYDDDLSRTRVIVRLIALAMIYREFCKIGCDEDRDESEIIEEAFDSKLVSPFRLGQLVGQGFEARELEAEDGELAYAALVHLADQERKGIASALIAGFESEVGLASALFATSRLAMDEEDETSLRGWHDADQIPAARVLEWIPNDLRRL